MNHAQVWIFLGIEHGMLLFKYVLETLINDTPVDVGIQLKRNEFIVSKVQSERQGRTNRHHRVLKCVVARYC